MINLLLSVVTMEEKSLKLGNYYILEKIAQGGMAQIFKAKTADPNGIERLVVIKRILPHISSHPEYIEMLIDEAKIAVQFTHGNIAQIYDLGKIGEDYFIVMEYVDGKTLSQILREFRERAEMVPIEIIAYCIMEVCYGLDYIHRRKDTDGRSLQVIHRDISPQNIIVSYSGSVKIIDFGVAKSLDKLGQTESGVLKGKYAYMSPEQASLQILDRRSDIFSAGVLLWEFLCQQRLFKKKSNPETIKAVKKKVPKAPSVLRADVHEDLDKIVLKALQKRRSKRYQWASEMADDLLRFLRVHYPDFKPVHVAQFLYRYFGPEPDEEDLPRELPELEVQKKEKIVSHMKPSGFEEEDTQVESIGTQKVHKRKGLWMVTVTVIALIISSVMAWWSYHALLKSDLFNRSSLNVQVIPEEAKLILNGKRILLNHGQMRLKTWPDESFHIKVSMHGYEDYTKNILMGRSEAKTIKIQLQKKEEVSEYGDLYVESYPEGAKIYLENMEWPQRTPAMIPRLQKDKSYQIGVFLEGYDFIEDQVTIQPGQKNNRKFELKATVATLEINSSPLGAHVIIDGQQMGTTPYINDQVVPNIDIQLELSLEGYQIKQQTVKLSGGEKQTLDLQLIPLGP